MLATTLRLVGHLGLKGVVMSDNSNDSFRNSGTILAGSLLCMGAGMGIALSGQLFVGMVLAAFGFYLAVKFHG